MNTIFLFSKIQTTRFQYITHELLENILDFELVFLNEEEAYKAAVGIKINYSDAAILEKEIHIIPQNLLFEDRKSTRLNSSHRNTSRMPSSA